MNKDSDTIEKARAILDTIVVTEGCDRGIVLLDHEGRTKYDPVLQCQVYLNENFSPLGDALIRLWDVLSASESAQGESRAE